MNIKYNIMIKYDVFTNLHKKKIYIIHYSKLIKNNVYLLTIFVHC